MISEKETINGHSTHQHNKGYIKPTSNHYHAKEKTGCQLSLLQLNIVRKVLDIAIREENKRDSNKKREEGSYCISFADDYVKRPKRLYQRRLKADKLLAKQQTAKLTHTHQKKNQWPSYKPMTNILPNQRKNNIHNSHPCWSVFLFSTLRLKNLLCTRISSGYQAHRWKRIMAMMFEKAFLHREEV